MIKTNPGVAGEKKSSSVLGNLEVSNKLQVLAKKQRMNTEVRRNIFYVIMTSEVHIHSNGRKGVTVNSAYNKPPGTIKIVPYNYPEFLINV